MLPEVCPLPTLADVEAVGGESTALRALAQSDSKALSRALTELGFVKLGDRSTIRQLLLHGHGAAASSSARPQTAPTRPETSWLSVETIAKAVDEWLAPAVALKEQGNKCFKAGEYEKARALYEEGIRSLPQGRLEFDGGGSRDSKWRVPDACAKAKVNLISTLWSNLAAAQVGLKQWEAVEEAAGMALRFKPRHGKALLRRAVARRHRGLLQEAKADLMNAMHAEASLRDDCLRELELIDPRFRREKPNQTV